MKNLKTLSTYASEFITRTLVNIERGVRHTDRIHGPSGIGKTAIIKQIVERLTEITGNEWGFATINVANHGAWDLIGVPNIVEGKTTFAAPEFLPDLSQPGTPAFGIFFVDEIDKAEGDMVNAMMPLINEGKLGSYTIPEGWLIIGAGNRLADSAGSRVVPNVANARRAIDVGIYACPDELVEYAAKSDWHPMVSAFLKFQPQLVHEFPNGIESKKAKTITGFACPATWEITSDFLHYDFKPEVLQGYLADGVLSEGVAIQFCNFLKVVNEIPNFGSIFRGERPEVAANKPDIKWALISNLAYKVSANLHFSDTQTLGDAWSNAVSYCHEVLGPEFGATFVRLATAKNPELMETAVYRDYKDNNQDLFLTNR